MAELRRTFSAGRMNKDIDERLLSPGEYRDALNVGVGNSESSDIGSVENLLGNQLIQFTQQELGGDDIAVTLENATTVGSIRHDLNERIYYFVASSQTEFVDQYTYVGNALGVVSITNNSDGTATVRTRFSGSTPGVLLSVELSDDASEDTAIEVLSVTQGANEGSTPTFLSTVNGQYPNNTASTVYQLAIEQVPSGGTGSSYIFEYDQPSNRITPVLSDTQDVLGFRPDNLITGINILGDQLFWTDNDTEPKKINISKFRAASAGSITHTQVYGRDFVEDDITVIKKSPLNAPNVEGFQSLEGDGNYTASVSFDFSFEDVDDDGVMFTSPIEAGSEAIITVLGSNLAYRVGDQVRLLHDAQLDNERVEILATIININNNRWVITINTSDQNIPLQQEVVYSISLFDAEVLFELKFPRFAYRWRYEDGEYSVLSPFSEVVFVPGDYQYNAEEGYNIAMTNTIRRVILDGFDTPPSDVVEVDLLYKQSNTTAVYTVETIPSSQTSADILRDQIHALIQDNQLLRPYDNVPKTAKAQEVIANRLVYGNYTHNYDVTSEPIFLPEVNETNSESSLRSLKSIRDYQFGIVYQDNYGRQTPVLSNTTGGVNIPVSEAPNRNQFCVTMNNEWPNEDLTHYKYYIKETSTEYYNLALDRFYTGDDGYVWLSFPSSEFNKVNAEDYIYLKKQHTTGEPVTAANSRYKVLDVQTEAPDFIQRRLENRGSIPYQINSNTNSEFRDLPTDGAVTFDMRVSSTDSLAELISIGNSIRFNDGSNASQIYEITSVVREPESTFIDLSVNVDALFREDISFVADPMDEDEVAPLVNIEIYEEVVDQLPEFIGRFFVKIILNGTFRDNVITPSMGDVEPVYGVVETQEDIYSQLPNSGPGDANQDMFFDFRNRMWSHRRGNLTHRPKDGEGIQQGSRNVHISQVGIGPNNYFASRNRFQDFLGKTGTRIRFTGGNATDTVYEITSVNHQGGINGQDPCDTFAENTGINRCNSQQGSGTQTGNGRGWRYQREGDGSNQFKRWELLLDKPIDFDPGLGFGTGAHDRTYSNRDTTSGIGIEILQDLSEIGRTSEGGSPYASDPAIFETEPRGDDLLDIYYETQETFTREQHGSKNTLKWFNCFSFGNGVESDRIRDDFNGVRIDKGPRVSATIAEQFREEHRPSGFIWSGIYNSTTGINNTNQFILAEGIQKELQPLFGSIQKLHARDTNLITFCEDKVLRILADKDALFNADGSTNVTASNNVLGQTVPYTGEYGISRNPESFATYGTRIYFTDKNRGVILRLSQDGLTEISGNGLEDFTRDLFMSNTGHIVGSYDDYHDVYNVSFDNFSLTYHEHTQGWPSRKSFIQESGLTLNNIYYTFKNGQLYRHNSTNVPRNNFYGTQYSSSIVFIFNDQPGSIKNFKTMSYEGTQPKTITTYDVNDNPVCSNTSDGGWFCPTFITDQQVGDARSFLKKEGKWFTDFGVLGGATAIEEVTDVFDNLGDGNGGEDGPLLDDGYLMDILEGEGVAVSDTSDDGTTDGAGDGTGDGTGEGTVGDGVGDVDNNPFEDDFGEDGEIVGELEQEPEEVGFTGNPIEVDSNGDLVTTDENGNIVRVDENGNPVLDEDGNVILGQAPTTSLEDSNQIRESTITITLE